jgi:hypothetical protein
MILPVFAPTLFMPEASNAWNPNQLSGILAWWDADLGVSLSGSNVVTWTDQSTNAYVLGQNGVSGQTQNKPTFSSSGYNSKNGVIFAAASSQSLSTTASVAYSSTNIVNCFIAAMYNTDNNNSAGRIVSVNNGSGQDYSSGNSFIFFIMINGGAQPVANYCGFITLGMTNANPSLSTPYRFGSTANGNAFQIYLNNVAQTGRTFAVGLSLGSGAQITIADGAGSGSGTGRFDGVIRRMIFTQGVVPSSTDLSNIDTWLSN